MHAFIVDGDVRDLIAPSDVPLAERFSPGIVETCVPVPPDLIGQVDQRWRWDGTAFLPPELPALSANKARQLRDRRLAASDWSQLPDAPLSAEERAAWAGYRQALRAVPAQAGFPTDITWPAPPASEG